MKYRQTALVLAVLAMTLMAGETARAREGSVDSRILKYCDPVCEIEAQDRAYSILIEAYRQFRSYQIQNDYMARLRAAAGLSDEVGSLVIDATLDGVRTLRAWVIELARKERDLRMEQLQVQVANFHTAYGCARKLDEEDIETRVPSKVDTGTAAQALKRYNVVALGPPMTAKFRTVKAVPASRFFVDAPQIEVPPERLIQPCD
jgi:hypothetical protein